MSLQHSTQNQTLFGTPGEVYRFLSTLFRERRDEGHDGCLMPAPELTALGGLAWSANSATPCCTHCESLAFAIIRENERRIVVGVRPSPRRAANAPFSAERRAA
jgi:hypothetical protein